MKYRKITIAVEGIAGSAHVAAEDAEMMFCHRDSLLVNEVPLRHHGFTIGIDDEEGFLTLTIHNVEEDVFNEFMANETPDDALEGTGVQTFTTEKASIDPIGVPDTLTWRYGTDIVLPIHDLELRVLAPKEAERSK